MFAIIDHGSRTVMWLLSPITNFFHAIAITFHRSGTDCFFQTNKNQYLNEMFCIKLDQCAYANCGFQKKLTFYVRPSSRVAWTDSGSEHVKQMSSEQNKVFCIRYFFTTVVLHTCVVLLCVIPYFQCFWGWWLPIWCTWCKVLSLSWGKLQWNKYWLFWTRQ